MLFVLLSCLAWNAGAQRLPPLPLSMSRKDVAKLVMEAPPAYIRESAPGSYHVGLFNKNGKQLLGFHFFNISNYDTGVALHDNILFLSDTERYDSYRKKPFNGLATDGAYSRSGELLYEAFVFDNGPDYFTEGRQRFVYDGKMGFVNRLGDVTVPARYTFVEPYRNGVAYACLDCVYTVLDSTDKEHCCGFTGASYELIDKGGRVLARKKTIENGRPDFQYPIPRLSPKEAALARIISSNPIVRGLLKEFDNSTIKGKSVCYDVPSRYAPFYHIALVDPDNVWTDNFQFLISPDGRRIFHLASNMLMQESLAAWKRFMYAARE